MTLQDTSVFDAHSPQARAIERLFMYDLGISAVIFLTVALLVAYAIFRFRKRPGHDIEPKQDEGNPRLEMLWTAIPALILLSLLVATAYTMRVVNPPAEVPTPNVRVIAHQWWWEFRYPKSGVITANELHLPLGEKWLLGVTSADVIHDFWVPNLSAKVDANPNSENFLWVQPTSTGIFWGTCAEYCGVQHAGMHIRVVVEPPEQFADWIQAQLQVPQPPSTPETQRGAELFQSLTCINCHAIAGTKAKGRVGPDLTHVGSRQTLGSGVANNTLDTMALWIADPQKVKPGCNMPSLKLTPEQSREIAVYLESLQ